MRCNQGNWSFWGCGQNPGLGVNVEITNSSGTTLLPSPCAFSKSDESKQSSRIPGYSPFSQELVLSACSNPPNVTEGQFLDLWYSKPKGPSSGNKGDKGGKSCCDVYARFT